MNATVLNGTSGRTMKNQEDSSTAVAVVGTQVKQGEFSGAIAADDTPPSVPKDAMAESLIPMMMYTSKMYGIFDTVKENKLELPTEIGPEDYKGYVLFAGTQSVGKSSTASRLTGRQILLSGTNICTR